MALLDPVLTPLTTAAPLAERAALTAAVTDGQGMLVAHHRTFNTIYNAAARVYSGRWDEALRHGRENALAIRRDAYLRALEQERVAPLTRWKWEVAADPTDTPAGGKDPYSEDREAVRRQLEACLRRTADLHQMRAYLGTAVFFGRYGSQVRWDEEQVAGFRRRVVGRSLPVHGDKIVEDYDGVPGVLVNAMDRDAYGKDAVRTFDGVGPALMLTSPEYRQRFVVHRHLIEDADYTDPLAAGRVAGVGLRDFVYWAWWLRDEMIAWMTDYMEKVGNMGLMLFYYEEGNAESQAQAEDAARAAKGRSALAVPTPKGGKDKGTAKVELIAANTAGSQFLKEMIADYFERHIERLFVGQSLSSGTEGSGLGGSGVAELHANTKFQLLAWDAENLGHTLTNDLLRVSQRLNFREAPWRYEWRFILPDPGAKDRLDSWAKIKDSIAVKADEVREVSGWTKPDEGDETVGGPQQQPQPGAPGAPGQPPPAPGQEPPSAPDGQQPGAELPRPEDDPAVAEALDPDSDADESDELYEDIFGGFGDDGPQPYADYGRLLALYAAQDWEPHTIKAGPRKGQQGVKNKRTGEIRDSAPAKAPTGAERVDKAGVAGLAKGAEVAGQLGEVGEVLAEGAAKLGAFTSWLQEKAGKKTAQAQDWAVGQLEPSWVGRRLITAGWGAKKAYQITHHLALYSMHKSHQLAVTAARERGVSERGAVTLTRCLFIGDMLGGYATGYGAHLLGTAAGEALGGGLAGEATHFAMVKGGMFLPSVSLAYLIYSTAKNPPAMWRAARQVAAQTLKENSPGEWLKTLKGQPTAAKPHYAKGEQPGLGLARKMAEGVDNAEDPEWYAALVHAGVARTGGDADAAMKFAAEASQAGPPEEVDEVDPGSLDTEHAHVAAAMVELAASGEFDAAAALSDATPGEAEDEAGSVLYFREGLELVEVTTKDGKKVKRWKSKAQADAGGTGPAKADPAGGGRTKAEEKAGAKKAASDAFAAAAKGDADALAKLPAALQALTTQELAALRKTVAEAVKRGVLKRDQIDNLVAYARKKAADAKPAEPPKPAATPAAKPPEKPNAIDFMHRDADHPVAKHIAADAKIAAVLAIAEPARAASAALRAAQATEDALWAELSKAKKTYGEDKFSRMPASTKWLNSREATRRAKAKLAKINDDVRAGLVAMLKPDSPVEIVATELTESVASRALSFASLASSEKVAPSIELAKAGLAAGVAFMQSVTSRTSSPIAVQHGMSSDGRAFYSSFGGDKPTIAMGLHADVESATAVAIHEYGHAIEESDPSVKAYVQAFLDYRTSGEAETDLGTLAGGGSMKGEKGRKDSFDRSMGTVSAYYCGKAYSSGATEILSMGVEKLYKDPAGFMAADPEYAALVIGVLRGDRGPPGLKPAVKTKRAAKPAPPKLDDEIPPPTPLPPLDPPEADVVPPPMKPPEATVPPPPPAPPKRRFWPKWMSS